MWCGVIDNQMTGLYIFLQCLRGNIYANILQDELLALLENVLLQTHNRCITSMMERHLISVRL